MLNTNIKVNIISTNLINYMSSHKSNEYKNKTKTEVLKTKLKSMD